MKITDKNARSEGYVYINPQILLLPCDSYTEANESYLVSSSSEQSHVLTNKDTLKLGHIGNLGH